MRLLSVNEYYSIIEREFNKEKRNELAASGEAMQDGSFPIVNKTDLINAIKSYGLAKDKSAAKVHIINRAKSLELMDLIPESW